MKIHQHLTRLPRRLLLPIGLATAMVTIGFIMNRALAEGAVPVSDPAHRVVSIYDRGTERVIVTKARTIRQALDLAEVTVQEGRDVVEPGLDTELVATKYHVNIYRARPVTIEDGVVRRQITTAEQTAANIARAAQITVYPEDRVSIAAAESLLVDGANIVMRVDRATPISLTLYGKKTDVRTRAATVGDLLREKQITLQPDDTLSLPETTPIASGLTIELWRNGTQTMTVDEEVAYPTEVIQDANRDLGFKEVKQPGEKGTRRVTYEVEMRNGQEYGRKEIASVMVKEPKKQVEVVGSKAPPVMGRDAIIAMIRQQAALRGLDPEKVVRIARCESTFNPQARNGIYQGLFQHHAGYWPARAKKYGVAGASIFDAQAQIIVTTSMMADVGYGPWECK